MLRYGLIFGGTVLAVACMSPMPASEIASTRPAGFGQASNMSKLYNETCAKCHGANGQGGGAGTKTLLTREGFDQKNDRPYFDAIKNGVKDMGMEAYGETLSEPEIWGLVVHIREMQASALRAENGGPKETNGVYASQRASYQIETVVDTDQGLRTPWAIDWLPNGLMLVTNRSGKLSTVRNGKAVGDVTGIPVSREIGQGGLMDVAVHPDYRKNGWVYLSFTEPSKTDQRAGMTKIVRGKLKFSGDNAVWTDEQTIFECAPNTFTGSGVHFGSRIVFDQKGHVFFSIGERGDQSKAPDLTRPNGKIYRVNEDGSIPKDNPFVSDADKAKGVIPQIWSCGHRNPQGLTFDLQGGLWDTEHAPRGGDELNLVVKGANYGWPTVGHGINYNDSPIATPFPKPDEKINVPTFRWLPSIGACGLDTVKGSAFPGWKGDLVAGGLSGQNVDRIRVKDGQLVEREELVYGMGRVREVTVGPDGFVYVALNQPDKIIRLVPAK